MTKTAAQAVPYRGGAPAMQDLVGGQIDLMVADPVVALPQVRGGGIKAYAVTAASRLSTAPDIPTADEAGLPGYHVSLWHGMWMPKGTPQPIMDKLSAAVIEALADPAVRAKVAALGHEIFPRERQTAQALDAHQRAEIAKWYPLIKAADIKVE
jgi:tripartite-type tricarboxylate transporter receptor subunit TctC